MLGARHGSSRSGMDGADGANVTMEGTGFLANCRYLLRDRDSKYCVSFRGLIESGESEDPASAGRQLAIVGFLIADICEI